MNVERRIYGASLCSFLISDLVKPRKVVTTDAWSLDRQMGACCTVPIGMVLAAEEKAIDQEVDRFVKGVQ